MVIRMTDEKPDPKPEPAPAATFTRDPDTPETLAEVFERPEVKAITPLREQPAPSDRSAAVHDGELWGGPRFIHDAESQPVLVSTKEEYWALLAKNGLRMRDQQESVIPSDVPRAPEPTPVHHTPHPDVAPMTKHEAEIFGAITAVFRRYNLVESLWCSRCFARNLPHGCRMYVSARGVKLQCRGGVAAFETPVGETNLLLHRLANTTVTALDRTGGTVLTLAGPIFKPARLLVPEEVMIIRAYIAALNARGIEPRWHHRDCWSGNPWHEDDALALHISDDRIIAVCRCVQLYAARPNAAPPLVH
jgi:hypothetical protein